MQTRGPVGVEHAEVVEARGRADHVDEGVNGADLVEVNLLGGGPVDAGLGLGEALEHSARPSDDGAREARGGEPTQDTA